MNAIIKNKINAHVDFSEGVKKGYTMALSEEDAYTKDIMKLNLGNLLPNTTLKVTLSYI